MGTDSRELYSATYKVKLLCVVVQHLFWTIGDLQFCRAGDIKMFQHLGFWSLCGVIYVYGMYH